MANELRARPPVSATVSDRIGHLDALDGLRAIAALMVLTTHVAFHTGLVVAPVIGPITSRLDFGVCVFFLLSGFLLYRPWAKAAMLGCAGPGLRAYARKRFSRIYPAYLVLVIVVLGWYLAPTAWDQWLAYLTLTQVYVPGMTITELNQTWSLAAEVGFYAALPLIGWTVLRRHRGDPNKSARWQFGVLAGMSVVTLVYQLIRSWTTLLPDWLSSFWLPGFLDWFAAGMALAVVQVRLSLPASVGPPGRGTQRLGELGRDSWTCLLVAGLLFAIAATPAAGKFYFDGTFGPDVNGPWAILVKHYLYAGCAFFLLMPLALGHAAHPYAQAMASPFMRRLGTISYGIFLWHLLMLSMLADLFGFPVFGGGFWLLWPTTLVSACVVAALSWHLLEKPILRRARRVGASEDRPVLQVPSLAPR